MKLPVKFFDPNRRDLAERVADEMIANGDLAPSSRESYIRGYCRRAVGEQIAQAAAEAAQETTMNITAKTDLTRVESAALLAYFNAHSPKPVKRFATRAVAERRVRALLDSQGKKANKAESKKVSPKPEPAKKAQSKKADDKEETPMRKVFSRATHANAVSATWQDPDVAAARRKRHAVRAQGITYRSVREAFKALGLPDAKHQAFRKVLAAEGTGTFGDIAFKVVDAE